MYHCGLLLGHIFSRFVHSERDEKIHWASACFASLFSNFKSLPPQDFPSEPEDFKHFCQVQTDTFKHVLKLVDPTLLQTYSSVVATSRSQKDGTGNRTNLKLMTTTQTTEDYAARPFGQVLPEVQDAVSEAEIKFYDLVRRFVKAWGMDHLQPKVCIYILDVIMFAREDTARTQLAWLVAVAVLWKMVKKDTFEGLVGLFSSNSKSLREVELEGFQS
jgi:hypothetical protein